MKKRTTDEITDDEILREQGMTSGPLQTTRWELRPTCALEISWLQRNGVLSPDMDILWRAAAFAYIHSAPKSEIRKSVNESSAFKATVDRWLDDESPTAKDIAALSEAMNKRTAEYFAAFSSTGEDSSGN